MKHRGEGILRLEDAGTSEEDYIDSQDSNIPIDHGHLAQNCSIKTLLSGRNIKNSFIMVIPRFGRAMPQLGHNMVQTVGPGTRKDNYIIHMRKILPWIGTCPG